MLKLNSPELAIEKLIEKMGKEIILAAPLAAGKANHLLNALYLKAKSDATIKLTILTALTLQKPKGKSFLETRFLEPFADRVFGAYPNLLYEIDRLSESLPTNVQVIEFYHRAGQYKNHNVGQRNYLSSNYTHVVRDCLARGVNVICQQVCAGEIDGRPVYSLSCNSDTSRDLADLLKQQCRPFANIAQVNQDLPFMYGEAVVSSDYFDILVDNRELDFPVFAPPKMSVSDADYMIGFHSSTLVKDDGEIQIGIGSLGDALVYGLSMRHEQNAQYQEILNRLEVNAQNFPVIKTSGDLGVFKKGLFAATEMLVDSFSELYKKKILKKKVYDSVIIQRLLNQGKIKEEFGTEIFDTLYKEKVISPDLTEKDFQFLKEFGIIQPAISWANGQIVLENGDKIQPHISSMDLNQIIGSKLRNGAVAHCGFFLGPRAFYDFLKNLPVPERKLFRMKRISQINHLYGHEEVDRLQRVNGRFINTCMKVTLNGSACSDALEDGNQISGVGGQYNFVAMAHELPDARSILQLRSTRVAANGDLESNIVFNYGNCTIPRHLRDIIVTEYGLADLRAKTDEEVAVQLIQITDSRFQPDLINAAIKAHKLPKDFLLANRFSHNLPERYTKILKTFKTHGLFPLFPLGSDLTAIEIRLGGALKKLKKMSKTQLAFQLVRSIFKPIQSKNAECLKRMGLDQTSTIKEKLMQKLVHAAL